MLTKSTLFFSVLGFTASLVFITFLANTNKKNNDNKKIIKNDAEIVNSAKYLLHPENISPAVVELFTSEGCSSCPSADNLVAKAQNEFNDNTIVLSYHVDYWDRLGWKDPFSKSIFSQRQLEYARHFKLESVYTPQAIVNGKIEFVGSSKTALWNAIQQYRKIDNKRLAAVILPIQSNKLQVNYSCTSLNTNDKVVIELVLKNAVTRVKSGENEGATLVHIQVVQDIRENETTDGIATFTLPEGFIKEKYIVVAFIQNRETMEITTAKKIII